MRGRHGIPYDRRYDFITESYGRGRPEHGQRANNVFHRRRERKRSESVFIVIINTVTLHSRGNVPV